MSAPRAVHQLALWAALAILAPCALAGTEPDGKAAADSVTSPVETQLAPRAHHPNGGRALAVGVASTFAPAALAVMLNPPGSTGGFAWEASLASGAALGVIVGPAVGLRYGGRADLADRGMWVRAVCASAAGAGLYSVLTAMSEERNGTFTVPLLFLGLAGGAVCVISYVHDLAITPSAVDGKRTTSWRAGVDPHGRFAVQARF